MANAYVLAILCCSVMVLSGCGTVTNLKGNDPYATTGIPYGGVQYDLDQAVGFLTYSPCSHDTCLGLMLVPCAAVFFVVDIPLSAIGDTITLPLLPAKSMDLKEHEPKEVRE